MALQASGAISLSQIQTEFGGSNPVSLSEYYRGGIYTSYNNSGVPTTGAISLSNFYSTTNLDLIPNSVDWTNISSYTSDDSGFNSAPSNTQTITGISNSITLNISTTNWGCLTTSGSASVELRILKNSVLDQSLNIAHNSSGASNGTFAANANIVVNENDTIQFDFQLSVDAISAASGETTGTITVKNSSVDNTVLDTFTFGVGATTSGGV